MTIYHLELTLANLCRVKSALAIHDLCILIWARALRHLHDSTGSTEDKCKLATYSKMVQWYLGIIVRTILHAPEHETASLVVGDIYVEKPRDSQGPELKQAFTLDIIGEVEDEVLVGLLHRLLDLTVQALIPRAVNMSQTQVQEWAGRAMGISKDLAVLLDMTPLEEEDSQGDDFSSIMINFRLVDQHTRVLDYL